MHSQLDLDRYESTWITSRLNATKLLQNPLFKTNP